MASSRERKEKFIKEGKYNLIPCACGCGQQIRDRDYKGNRPKFAYGHNVKLENNPRWNGGIRIDKDGYRYIRRPEHPLCDYAGYVPEHRLVYENYLSIIWDEDVIIPKKYEIHHENEITNDNRLINLVCLTHKEHSHRHRKKIIG